MSHSSGLLAQDLTRTISNAILSNLDGDSYRDSYLGRQLLAKFADPDKNQSKLRAERAVQKWLGTEVRNSRTNSRVYLSDAFPKVIGGMDIEVVLDHASRTIRRLIGSYVPLDTLYGDFSGGASTSKRRQPGTLARKFAERPDVTQQAWDYIWPWIYRDHDVWHAYNPKVLKPRFVRGNVMFTVPKNNEIDRVACKEPDLNMFIQKAAGNFFRRRLKYVGIDLNDQQVNQRLAHQGSIDGSLCTIDLSSASDSVTTQLVCRLLPTDWFHFLESIRCRYTRLPDGTWHENEMISSMGNGFTFELESLIFYSLVKAVSDLKGVRERVSVFGDDIICSSSIYKPLVSVLGFCGFVVNKEKSFYLGKFRESCGKHYFAGVDVTPFYIRRPITNIHELIRILNKLRAWSAHGGTWCDDRWYGTWVSLSRLVPKAYSKAFGGYDTDSTETIASLRGRAYRVMRKVKNCRPRSFEVGLYLEWQADARDRRSITESRLSIQYDLGRVEVVKPRRGFAFAFGLSAPVFPQEYAKQHG